MELYLKQKVFSIKGKFNVYDVEQNPVYTVEGKVASLHQKHYIYDKNGEEVAYIHQKIVSLMHKFYIERVGGETYEMKSKLKIGHSEDVIESLGWKIEGRFLQHDYAIMKDGEEIASIHQKWLAWGDTYEITVEEGVDEVLVLAAMLCIDIIHEEEAVGSAIIAAETIANSDN